MKPLDNEPANLWTPPEFEHAQRRRKRVEALFAELKSRIGPGRLRLRRLRFVREQFFLAATAQNIKRLVRFLSGPTTPPIPVTLLRGGEEGACALLPDLNTPENPSALSTLTTVLTIGVSGRDTLGHKVPQELGKQGKERFSDPHHGQATRSVRHWFVSAASGKLSSLLARIFCSLRLRE